MANDPYYRERKSGKAITDFILASHPEDGQSIFHRIRAFDAQAAKVRDEVRKGQTDVEVHAYGKKTWQDPVKTGEGWTRKERQGYYAGFIKVPRRYQEETPEPQSTSDT